MCDIATALAVAADATQQSDRDDARHAVARRFSESDRWPLAEPAGMPTTLEFY
jgi:hypothetical protein